jgi:hypothetical protein
MWLVTFPFSPLTLPPHQPTLSYYLLPGHSLQLNRLFLNLCVGLGILKYGFACVIEVLAGIVQYFVFMYFCLLSSGYPRQVFYFVFLKSFEPSYVPCDVLHWSLVISVPVSCLCVCVFQQRTVIDYCHFIHIIINLFVGYSCNSSNTDCDVRHHQPSHNPLFRLEKSGGVYCLLLAYREVVTSHANRLTLAAPLSTFRHKTYLTTVSIYRSSQTKFNRSSCTRTVVWETRRGTI